jgi:hypothetical protein
MKRRTVRPVPAEALGNVPMLVCFSAQETHLTYGPSPPACWGRILVGGVVQGTQAPK